MSRGDLTFKYRVAIHIREDDEWEDQYMFLGSEWAALADAEKQRDEVDLSHYSAGTYAFIESMFYSDWAAI